MLNLATITNALLTLNQPGYSVANSDTKPDYPRVVAKGRLKCSVVLGEEPGSTADFKASIRWPAKKGSIHWPLRPMDASSHTAAACWPDRVVTYAGKKAKRRPSHAASQECSPVFRSLPKRAFPPQRPTSSFLEPLPFEPPPTPQQLYPSFHASLV